MVEPDDGPVEENFQIRAALESLGASLAAYKINADGIGRLRDLNDQMRALGEDDSRYADLNRESTSWCTSMRGVRCCCH